MVMDEKVEYFKLPFYKRLSALMIDLSMIVVLFTIFLLPISSIISNRINKNEELQQCVLEMNEILLDSGLFIKVEVEDENNGKTVYEVREEISDNSITNGAQYLGLKDDYFKLKEESGLFEYNNGEYIEIGEKTELDKFYDEAWKNYYNKVIKTEEYVTYNQRYAEIMNGYTSSTYAISSVISIAILFLIIPLCNKSGKTLGKLLFKISVINDFYEKPNKLQVFVRQFFFVILNFLFIPAILSLVISLFEKRGKSLHGYISSTRLIDSNVEKILIEKMKNKKNENIKDDELNFGEVK